MKKMLIADDNKQITIILSGYAKKEGFEPVVALDGAEALDKYLQYEHEIAVVLLDVMMPEIDGFEVCRRLRKESMVPIIMITARGEDYDKIMGELAATGSKGVEMIAAMLVPADKGKNATFEYALNGVVAYVTDPAHEALRDDVRKGLLAAIDRCGDDANRAFLFSQLQFCSTAADAAAMARGLEPEIELSEVRRLLDAGACTDAEESAGPGGLSVTLFFPANDTFP